jgi:hypothetical protein
MLLLKQAKLPCSFTVKTLTNGIKVGDRVQLVKLTLKLIECFKQNSLKRGLIMAAYLRN